MKILLRFSAWCRWNGSGEPDNHSWTTIHDMPPRASTPRPAWLYRFLRGLTFLLLPTWLPDNAHATALARRRELPAETEPSVPYLVAMGPKPLRFQDAPVPPPDLVTRPVAGGPPQPEAPALIPAPALVAAVKPPPAETSPARPPAPAATSAPSVLPDETRPKVRAEDFLPFFQFPANGDVTVVAPVPPSPPASDHPIPSSATYRQQ